MNRIDKKLKEEGKLLSIYFTAGFPNLNDTADIIINCLLYTSPSPRDS